MGVQVHDARLVPAMNVHGITCLLTLDRQGFAPIRETNVGHLRRNRGLKTRDRCVSASSEWRTIPSIFYAKRFPAFSKREVAPLRIHFAPELKQLHGSTTVEDHRYKNAF